MEELIFLVVASLEGGYTAKGLGLGIFTEGETLDELQTNSKDAIHCHYLGVRSYDLTQLYRIKIVCLIRMVVRQVVRPDGIEKYLLWKRT